MDEIAEQLQVDKSAELPSLPYAMVDYDLTLFVTV